jgi:hypothetical protein
MIFILKKKKSGPTNLRGPIPLIQWPKPTLLG